MKCAFSNWRWSGIPCEQPWLSGWPRCGCNIVSWEQEVYVCHLDFQYFVWNTHDHLHFLKRGWNPPRTWAPLPQKVTFEKLPAIFRIDYRFNCNYKCDGSFLRYLHRALPPSNPLSSLPSHADRMCAFAGHVDLFECVSI